jgi:hypothetical protein
MWRDVNLVTLNSAKTAHYILISISYSLLLYRQLFKQIKYFIFFFRNIFQRLPPTTDFRGQKPENRIRRSEIRSQASVVCRRNSVFFSRGASGSTITVF